MIIKPVLPLKYVFKEISVSLLVVLSIVLITDIPVIFFSRHYTEIPVTIPTTLGIAISILVSFKVNQSYDRWWEARKIWGAIVNDSRTLVLQLKMYTESDNPMIKTMAYRQIAWCYSLGQSLRGQNPYENLDGLISESELELLQSQKNVPLGILDFQADSIKTLFDEGKLDNFSRLQFEETLERLTASMGRCERIKNTVFPTTYRKGLHLAIYLFVIFLSLTEPLNLNIVIEVLVLLILSMVFLFLEKAAFRLQDPFENLPTDTPVTSIARTIDINIRQLLGETELPKPIEPIDFYIM
ncbi:bestrophin family protein [Flagellimonas zhangzhouensis]|uniref:Putative membrane protein n=1 Tax=Flagellimonas zhangzhouensis TaxID=1073328 RepID=A0A1H2VQG1_9FLAO|nr:bestrophin family ion channel [Allomuricauda zhangzhouensis]SDQ06327.1 putative membrane protein [Allomuricauda zhangzhouensis]SDW70508.1 putative membrane protein [Allomuricauda zhangzhouensis]